MSWRTTLALACLLPGCQSTSPAPAEYPRLPEEQAAEPAPDTGAPLASEPLPALPGLWAEYWAPEGQADTDRHLFMEDGRWSWLAAAGSAERVARVRGRWSLQGTTLLLDATQHDKRVDGKLVHDPEGAATRTPRALGACPPNEEARAMDQRYSCLTIDGRTFWRRAAPKDVDPAPFFD